MKHAIGRRAIIVMVATVTLGLQLSAQMQQVIAGGGSYFSNANGSIAWTLGEPVIATQTTAGQIITQGFHQPADDFTTTVTTAESAVVINVFPNPTRDQVVLQLSTTDTYGASFTLLDALGRQLVQQLVLGDRTVIDLSGFANGNYLLRVINAEEILLGTFKLTLAK